MNCEAYNDLILSYADGAAEPAAIAELLRHAETCEQCRESLRLLDKSKAVLLSAAPRPSVPASVWRRIENSLVADMLVVSRYERPSGEWRRFAKRLAVALPLAAALLFAIFNAPWPGSEPQSGSSPGQTPFGAMFQAASETSPEDNPTVLGWRRLVAPTERPRKEALENEKRGENDSSELPENKGGVTSC